MTGPLRLLEHGRWARPVGYNRLFLNGMQACMPLMLPRQSINKEFNWFVSFS